MTTSNVRNKNTFSEFKNWIEATCSNRPLTFFRIAFAAIWLTYDLLDVSLGQTAKILWFYRAPIQGNSILLFQILLIICEAALLIGWRPQYFAFCAFLARGFISYAAPLNDFFYFTMIVLILAQVESGPRPRAWPRDLLVVQTAWIYFASAFLKLNPAFLSGGDLYARANYEAKVLPLPYPQFYRDWISHIGFDATMAWIGALTEMSIAVLLVLWLIAPRYFPQRRKQLRFAAIALAVAVHGYAALFMNVFFFGLSMIAQVALLTYEP